MLLRLAPVKQFRQGDGAGGRLHSTLPSHNNRPGRPESVVCPVFLRTAKPDMVTRLLLTCFVLFLFPYSSFADFSGLVVSVLDGDTIEVLHSNRPERIRLNGIDCPEKGQAYSTRAKQAASDLVLGGEVTLQTYGKDKYGRTLAEVLLLDGTNVSHTLVEHGWCWWYRKYAPGDTELERLEKEARDAKKGLWVDPAPTPPWVYRKARRGQSLDLSDLMPSTGVLEKGKNK